VNQYPTTSASQDNGTPNEQQKLEFKNRLDKIAFERNGGFNLTRKQTNIKLKLIRIYNDNAEKGEIALNEHLDEIKNRENVRGGFFDVSSSEVDISEFSMDELAAHVENLTAELRAL